MQWLYGYLFALKYIEYIYDQTGNLIEEADENGEVISDYIYLGSTPIARVDEWWEGIQTPQAPTGVTLTQGNEELTVSWNANQEPVDGYKVYWGTESENYTNSVDVGKTTSYTITGLMNGITYYVAVKAYVDLRETYYYHIDHLGTPIMMTDKNQNVVWNGEFLPFGEPYSITASISNNLRFPGQYYDSETGLHYNWHRDYKPEIGRYIEFDPILKGVNYRKIILCRPPLFNLPIKYPQKLNPYIYGGNNPIRFTDLTGQGFCDSVCTLVPVPFWAAPLCDLLCGGTELSDVGCALESTTLTGETKRCCYRCWDEKGNQNSLTCFNVDKCNKCPEWWVWESKIIPILK
jgi:RHS repeat-associated protein